MSDKNKINSLNYYYKHKKKLDDRRKQLYQKNKHKIAKQSRVLNRCRYIIKYSLLLLK